MKEVLEAIEEMKARLNKTGNIIIGHNDCWALVLVYKQLVDHSYQQPKWTRQTFFSNKHFVLEMMKGTKTRSLQPAMDRFIVQLGLQKIENLEDVREGDLIARRTASGLNTSLVYGSNTEFFINERDMVVQSDVLPLLDRTIVGIGRQQQ